MVNSKLLAVFLLVAGLGLGYFDYVTENTSSRFPLKLGLDLAGGTHLVYKADTSLVSEGELADSLDALRDVIERRVNRFGVAEPLVQIEKSSIFSEGERENRLIVELPGFTDVDQAIEMIGATPVLEFKIERDEIEREKILALQEEARNPSSGTGAPNITEPWLLFEDPYFVPTDLTGRFLDKATVQFGHTLGDTFVELSFDQEGKELFAEITRANVGRQLAIYLDGAPISAPVIREEILGGRASITGDFNIQEAKELVGRLNSGAIPVPIELLSAQTIGASLGQEAYTAVLKAGIIGFTIVAVFLILWYRLPGLLATAALFIYAAIMLALFKLVPVTLTAAGIAGFILSVGMAVDANILIFERMKEELRRGSNLQKAIEEGFSRAWLSIRDSNLSSIISCIILFWFGTSLVEGFALTLGIGVLVSMFTALTMTRTFLFAIGTAEKKMQRWKFLFESGIR